MRTRSLRNHRVLGLLVLALGQTGCGLPNPMGALAGSPIGVTGADVGQALSRTLGSGLASNALASFGLPSTDSGTTLPSSDGSTPTAPSTPGALVPPLGESSGGTGGTAGLSGANQTAGDVNYKLIVPAGYAGQPTPLLVAYSGFDGADSTTMFISMLKSVSGMDSFIIAILDGRTYFAKGEAGATVLDDVRARYNIDNDRTYLFSSSGGTGAGQVLGFRLRQSYFAAFWANDVVETVIFGDSPQQNANQLGFRPWGQVGPGGQHATAEKIATMMRSAGYRFPVGAVPYNGPDNNIHAGPRQFMAAMSFFAGKVRQP